MFLCSTRLWSMAAMETDYFYIYFHSTRQLSLVTVMPFKVPDRSLQGFPFGVWPHLATHAAMSLLFWRVRQVLEGLKHISRRKWYVFFPGIVLTPCFRDGLWKAGAVSYLLYSHIQYIIESSYLLIDIGVSTKITKAVAFLPRSSIIISKGVFSRYLWDTIACEVKRVFPKLNPHRNARCTGCTLYAA